MTTRFAPVHPGEILLEEFLKPLGITQYRLALRLSRYFGLSERYWLNLQARYDLEIEKDRLEGRLKREVRMFSDRTLPAVSA